MSLRSPLGRARGLGSAKSGVEHFTMQRLSAIALVPLMLWFVAAVIGLAGASHAELARWLAHPLNATLMVLFAATGFYHSQLGLQVVIEDYVHHEGAKIGLLLLTRFGNLLIGTMTVVSILMLAFRG